MMIAKCPDCGSRLTMDRVYICEKCNGWFEPTSKNIVWVHLDSNPLPAR